MRGAQRGDGRSKRLDASARLLRQSPTTSRKGRAGHDVEGENCKERDCGNQHGVARHLGVQTGLHGVSPGLAWVRTLAALQVSCSTPASCQGYGILLVTRVTGRMSLPA